MCGSTLCLGVLGVWEYSVSGSTLCVGVLCVWEYSVSGSTLCLGVLCVCTLHHAGSDPEEASEQALYDGGGHHLLDVVWLKMGRL